MYEQYQILSYSQKHKLIQQKEEELKRELKMIKERNIFQHFDEFTKQRDDSKKKLLRS